MSQLTKVNPPAAGGPGGVGQQYTNLLNAFAGGQPTAFGAEAAWKPAYQSLEQSNLERWLLGGPAQEIQTPYQATVSRGQWSNPQTGEVRGNNPGKGSGFIKASAPTQVSRTATSQVGAAKGWLDLFSQDVAPALSRVTSQQRAADVGDVAQFGPGAAAAVRAVNPQQSALIDQLGGVAGEQLAAGTQVLPSEALRLQRQVRSDWSNRGLGQSAPAQLDEALQFYGAGQNVLAQRQQAAGQAAQLGQMISGPALGLATGGQNAGALAGGLFGQAQGAAGGAGPSIVPGAASYDIFNTAYNANAAANISTQNNRAGLVGGALSY